MEEEQLIRDLGSGYEDYKERRDLLKEIEELKKIKLFLDEEDTRLLREIDILSGELEGIEIAISASNTHILSYEKRKKECFKNIEFLRKRKEELIKEIDEQHLKVKNLKTEEKSSSDLNKNLRNELNNISNEKSRVVKRLDIVKEGIKSISRAQTDRLPNLEGCDSVLKQVYNVLRETQDRMEVLALVNDHYPKG